MCEEVSIWIDFINIFCILTVIMGSKQDVKRGLWNFWTADWISLIFISRTSLWNNTYLMAVCVSCLSSLKKAVLNWCLTNSNCNTNQTYNLTQTINLVCLLLITIKLSSNIQGLYICSLFRCFQLFHPMKCPTIKQFWHSISN